MNINTAMAYIKDTEKFGSRLGLHTITMLMNRLGNPERCLKTIHVAGTNGKGSTTAFMASVLKEAGYRVGTYTSPGVFSFHERIAVNGQPIDDDSIITNIKVIKPVIDQMIADGHSGPTEFELVTAMAIRHFAAEKCDYVILEVGLGGLTDATNFIPTPLLAVFTPIDYDHMQFLGNSLMEIASIKTGIIKPGGRVVTCEQAEEAMEVIKCTCDTGDNQLFVIPKEATKCLSLSPEALEVENKGRRFSLGMIASYQVDNVNLAIGALEVLRDELGVEISEEALKLGLEKARWAGRLEVIRQAPLTLIDGAHNAQSVRALKESLNVLYPNRRKIGVIGILKDKAIPEMVDDLCQIFDEVVLTQSQNDRAMDASSLNVAFYDAGFEGDITVTHTIEEATAYIQSLSLGDEDMVVYCGSLYQLGQVKEAYV